MASIGRAIVEKAGQHAPGLWSFGVTVAYVPFIPSGSTYGRYAFLGLGAAALLSRARIVLSPGHLMVAALLTWMCCGFLWTTSALDTAGEIVVWVMLAAAFCVAFDLPDLDDVWTGFCAGVLVSACFALAQAHGANPVWSIYKDPVGLFLSKNMATDVAVLALIASCARPRLVFMPAALVSLWLVGGRSAVLALGCAGFAFAWFTVPGRRLTIVGVALACSATIAAIASTGAFGLYADRLEIWTLVARHLSLVGHGLGTFAVAAPGLEYAHNEFLHYGFELGIGSVLLWGIFVYALGSGPILERVALVAILAESLVWFPLHAPVPAFLGMVLAGHLCGVRHRAGVYERARGMARSLGLFDGEPTFAGSLHEADHRRLREDGRGGADLRPTVRGRWPISARPEDSVGTGAVRSAVRGSRAEA